MDLELGVMAMTNSTSTSMGENMGNLVLSLAFTLLHYLLN